MLAMVMLACEGMVCDDDRTLGVRIVSKRRSYPPSNRYTTPLQQIYNHPISLLEALTTDAVVVKTLDSTQYTLSTPEVIKWVRLVYHDIVTIVHGDQICLIIIIAALPILISTSRDPLLHPRRHTPP